MDDNTEDGFENEENYYAFLNIAKSVNETFILCKKMFERLHQTYEIF